MGEATADAGRDVALDNDALNLAERWSMVRELKDSAMLIGFTLSTMGVYLGLGAVVVRIFANR
jgi:hypothetical protein